MKRLVLRVRGGDRYWDELCNGVEVFAPLKQVGLLFEQVTYKSLEKAAQKFNEHLRAVIFVGGNREGYKILDSIKVLKGMKKRVMCVVVTSDVILAHNARRSGAKVLIWSILPSEAAYLGYPHYPDDLIRLLVGKKRK